MLREQLREQRGYLQSHYIGNRPELQGTQALASLRGSGTFFTVQVGWVRVGQCIVCRIGHGLFPWSVPRDVTSKWFAVRLPPGHGAEVHVRDLARLVRQVSLTAAPWSRGKQGSLLRIHSLRFQEHPEDVLWPSKGHSLEILLSSKVILGSPRTAKRAGRMMVAWMPNRWFSASMIV